MSNWYDPDHLSDGKVRDISVHEENPDDWDCEIELNCHKTENSGRVSTVFMRYLRDKYGESTADRALKRAQKREQRARGEDMSTISTKMAGVFWAIQSSFFILFSSASCFTISRHFSQDQTVPT